MTGTFVYIKKDYSQNFFKNGWKMRCLWPSENQRNWTFDMIYWALRHDQNHSNWNLANILAWKTSFIIGLSYFIHLWKSFCLKLALNLSDPQAPHFTTIFEKILQTIIFYVNKNASYILVTICEPSRIPTPGCLQVHIGLSDPYIITSSSNDFFTLFQSNGDGIGSGFKLQCLHRNNVCCKKLWHVMISR